MSSANTLHKNKKEDLLLFNAQKLDGINFEEYELGQPFFIRSSRSDRKSWEKVIFNLWYFIKCGQLRVKTYPLFKKGF